MFTEGANGMGYREVAVEEIREVLRLWLGLAVGLPAPGLRTIAARAGIDRKTVRRYIAAAQAAGLTREAGAAALTDELLGAVVAGVRPARPNGHGQAWEALVPFTEQITQWVKGGAPENPEPLTVTKIHILLARQGCVVPYRTLVRFATECCGYRRTTTTVRVADGDPGVECQIDFGYLGLLDDASTGKRRKVFALVFTAVYSRHTFVWLTHTQTLSAILEGCSAAWEFFGGVFAVIIPDNMKPIVTRADILNPRLSRGWLDYGQHAGFVTDTARVATPTDKPRVERTIHYVQNNFWAGERFSSLPDAQAAAVAWCQSTAGLRIHGTTAAAPAVLFDTDERTHLLPIPADYDVPIFKQVKVHRDFHASVGKALYSLPETWIGSTLDVRLDSEAVKFYHRGELVKQHPRQPAGGQSTDPHDYPADKAAYALRNISKLQSTCEHHGPHIGLYAARIVDDPRPWSRVRAVYTLLGLVRTYGPGPVDAACATALEFDVIAVPKIASMLEQATENTTPDMPVAAGSESSRFARDPSEYATNRTQLTLVPNPDNTIQE
ncbi:IS21 family transposase [Gordonia sp. (in: high G+C Gram-positive bacteria)]|uniref:IS21 family transposase n=1 Tax=Gordonia sp. (in: high G+C Gram-positive bacteria) TaxID=84139 RepID=UPI0025794850|nr:IS21 family transposase [Gordonia sp. (in: high G+C Gram-positive bacteria)]